MYRNLNRENQEKEGTQVNGWIELIWTYLLYVARLKRTEIMETAENSSYRLIEDSRLRPAKNGRRGRRSRGCPVVSGGSRTVKRGEVEGHRGRVQVRKAMH